MVFARVEARSVFVWLGGLLVLCDLGLVWV